MDHFGLLLLSGCNLHIHRFFYKSIVHFSWCQWIIKIGSSSAILPQKTFRTSRFQHLQMTIPILMIPRHWHFYIATKTSYFPISFWLAISIFRSFFDQQESSSVTREMMRCVHGGDLWCHYLSGHHPSSAIIGTQRINFQPTPIKRGSWGQNTQVYAGRNNLLIQTLAD